MAARSSIDDAVAAVVGAAGKEMDHLEEALAGIVVAARHSTSADSAVIARLVHHTYVADHVLAEMQQKLESSIAGCGRRWEGTVASFERPPLCLEFLMLRVSLPHKIACEDASRTANSYLQKSMCLMRWVCCTDSGGLCNMEAPGDAVHLGLGRSEGTVASRVPAGTRWNAVVGAAELAGDVVDERCSRGGDAGGVGEVEDLAAGDGDDAA